MASLIYGMASFAQFLIYRVSFCFLFKSVLRLFWCSLFATPMSLSEVFRLLMVRAFILQVSLGFNWIKNCLLLRPNFLLTYIA